MKKWIKRGIIGVMVFGAMAGVASAIANSKAAREAAPKFKTAEIDKGSIAQVVLASGTLQPVNSVSVGVQVSGTVVERMADFNDHVKAGQVLLKLDPTAFRARVHQAQAQLESARASLVLATANEERDSRLQTNGFISGAAHDQTKRELDVALANVEVAKAQMDAVQTDLNNSVVRSPITGIVIKRSVEVGQTIVSSFQIPDLFLIAEDLKKMRIYANVSEADVGFIAPGQQVRFVVDAYPGHEFAGKVGQFRLNTNNTSGVVTYSIIIEVDNSDEKLKPGMTAQTSIVVTAKDNVLRIPTAALRFQPGDIDKSKDRQTEQKGQAQPQTQESAHADPHDNGVLSDTVGGKKLYRIYTVGSKPDDFNRPVQHEVTIGISNTRFTELTSGDMKTGDAVIVRSLASAGQGQGQN